MLDARSVEVVVPDELAGNPDPLVEANQMGRGVDMHAIAGGLGHRPQIGDQRALAVGARDMDQWRQLLFGRAESFQQMFDALQPEGDHPRVVAHQTLDNGVAHSRLSGRRRPARGLRRSGDP